MPDSAPVGRCRVFVAIRHAVPATHYSHTSVRDLQISHRAVVAAEVAINRRPSWQRRVIYVAEPFIGLCKAGVSPPPPLAFETRNKRRLSQHDATRICC